MSEIVNPDVMEPEATVAAGATAEAEQPQTPEVQSDVLDYSGKSIAELSDLFQNFATAEDRLQRAKEAEALKSAFYKTLLKEKEKLGDAAKDAFDAIEENFKALYAAFKKEKAEYNRQLDAMREENLRLKTAVIEELKALLDKDEDVSATFPAFRAIQDKWKEIGPVPVQNFRDLNNTYQLYVEQFYDKLKINRELRDLDFKKNLEAKLELCEKAEQLAAEEDILSSFRELQRLHDSWKDLGPVAKQFREEIWERFKLATAVINKKYQAYYEEQKAVQTANLDAKAALCEKVEAIAEAEISDSKQWNAFSKEIETVQQEWRKIGFATRKDNQKIYERFRAACDKFYGRKRDFYTSYKDDMENNLQRKEALCEQAEQLKDSTEWKKTTEAFMELQKQWKEIGAVPRKKSDQLWKRFRAACDEFFAQKEQNNPADIYRANLRTKRQIIEEIKAYVSAGDTAADTEAMNRFNEAFNAVGFVPFKEKETVAAAFKEAMEKAFPGMESSVAHNVSRPSAGRRPESDRDKLMARYRALEQEIATKENNIMFFAAGKAGSLLDKMQESIDKAKAELKDLESKIRAAQAAEDKEKSEE